MLTVKNLFKKNGLLKGFFLLGLIYILIPTTLTINSFPPLPNSTKSKLEGDTSQNPNIAAYFSQFRREFITKFYKSDFERKLIPGLPLPVVRINHPPEYAYTYIRDQQESTFLEEYTRPLRESLFVNGYEPLIENQIRRREASLIGNNIIYEEKLYPSKTTIRYYPTSPFFRVLVYIGIWISAIALIRLTIRVNKDY